MFQVSRMLLTLAIAFFSLIALMIIHEFGHFFIAKKFGVRVDEFGIGYPPRLIGKKVGETLYSINLIPLGAFVKIYGEDDAPVSPGVAGEWHSFARLSVLKRMLIVLGGVLAFWIASMVIFSVVFMIGAAVPVGDQDVAGITNTRVTVIEVQLDSPAAAAGLQAKDVLVSFTGKEGEVPINKIGDFQALVKDHAGQQISMTVNRGAFQQIIMLTPRVSFPEGQGPTGVALERIADIVTPVSWYLAPLEGIRYTGQITLQAIKGIYGVLADLILHRQAPPGAALAGPIGITIFLSRAVEYGPGFFLYFIGSLSVLLALFNLLPIPALDGGKLLFLIIEKIRRRPVSQTLEQNLTIIFFIILIVLSIIITIKFDIPRVAEFWRAGL